MTRSWRGFVGIDHRCYFSTAWWRRLKAVAIDAAKQRVRLRLLRQKPGAPLFEAEMVLAHRSAQANAHRGLEPLLYQDGFHPTVHGARVLASLLHGRITTTEHP